MRAVRATSVLVMFAAVAACAGSGGLLPLARDVDLDAMYGGWYIVATIPNRFEKGMVAPYDVYSKRLDGDIQEDFYLQKGGFGAPRRHFVAHDWVRPGTHNAHWRVQIFWPVNLPFLVLYTDPQYRFVLFGENDRSLGWIYSRTPMLDDTDYRTLLMRFRDLGYDPAKFRRVVQFESQIGMPGYWSDDIRRATIRAAE